ncbi:MULTISPECIES: hypothetical protein [Acidiphilium]|uniref:hypothetical protein n=1 Tax=Acidiphilium TaxID=522 RepID=UPI002917128A|nr:MULTISPECIES: hypothetical protein [Acidiphilium]
MNESTITAVGGNLFVLAATYLGDATQWIRIAQANDLSDPVLNGMIKLVLPPVDPSAGGGVPNV